MTSLATRIPLSRRHKPGKTVTVYWNDFDHVLPEFSNRYSYTVALDDEHAIAGNHYHLVKNEVYLAVAGQLTVTVEDRATHERETHNLSSSDPALLHISAGVAHAVQALTGPATLIVMADHPETETDTVPYSVIKPT